MRNRPALEQKTEKAPKRGSAQLGVTGAIATRLLHHKAGDVLGAERLEMERLCAKALTEKTLDRLEVVIGSGGRQAPLVEQIVLKVTYQAVEGMGIDGHNRAGDHPVRTQVLE
jgi:hypothetical protein